MPIISPRPSLSDSGNTVGVVVALVVVPVILVAGVDAGVPAPSDPLTPDGTGGVASGKVTRVPF